MRNEDFLYLPLQLKKKKKKNEMDNYGTLSKKVKTLSVVTTVSTEI